MPLLVGTQFISTLAAWAAGGDGWHEPEMEFPQPSNPVLFLEWLDAQHAFCMDAFGAVYAHGHSAITLEPTSPDGAIDPLESWNVTVWLDVGLDDEDPDLDEQNVLAQIIATSTLELVYFGEIAWESGQGWEADGRRDASV